MSPAVAVEQAVPREIIQQIKRRLPSVSMLPATAMQALEVVKDPDCSIIEFARVIERDVKLATDILAMANSSLFAGAQPLSSLHQAIVRLGLRQCKQVLYASGLSTMMQRLSREDASNQQRLWRHCFHTAILALHFNHSASLGFEGEEFTAGLMHDIGRLLLGLCLPERAAELDLLDFDGAARLQDREQSLTGTDHCELGAWFARQNNLPGPLVDAVRFHHAPGRAPREYQRLVALTAVCDDMANHLQRWGGPDGYDLRSCQPLAVLELSGVRDALRRFDALHIVLMRNALHDAEQMLKA